jgi:hypothetical protein
MPGSQGDLQSDDFGASQKADNPPNNSCFFEQEMDVGVETPNILESAHLAPTMDFQAVYGEEGAEFGAPMWSEAAANTDTANSAEVSCIIEEDIATFPKDMENIGDLDVDVAFDGSSAKPMEMQQFETNDVAGGDIHLPSEESQDFENYGDENAIPIDPILLHDPNFTNIAGNVTLSAALQTPTRLSTYRQREVHTVSKVPLRMEGPDESPVKIARKRSKSTSAPLGELPALMTPSNGCKSVSPVKSIRTGQDAQILRGAVIYVDVHTSEGADASSIFIELLTQMGARCVKQWTWNPRHSTAPDTTPCRGESTPSGKVGITHVVFKDGGKRTLQKVREAKGLVLCVGVSWVLE